ncbi:MAG: hypothetical protein LW602_05140 [Sediminibacterium sp.]|nr:hypothetical protein [Sediminibacterium sp.]
MSKNIYYSTTNKEKVVVPDSVWKQILSPEVYAVARQKGTERPIAVVVGLVFLILLPKVPLYIHLIIPTV